jgi:LCP family protein required for cell wall assembly
MAVIRMSLDESQFKEGSGASSGTSSTATRPLTVAARMQASVTTAPRRRKSKSLQKLLGFLIVIAIVAGGIFGLKQMLSRSGLTPDGVGSLLPVFQPKLQKDSEGKTNVLLIGIDTRETGPVELSTDTLILASYNEATNRLAMISFPRDLAVSYPGRSDLVRINSIYAIGEQKQKGAGLEKLKEVVETVSGKQVQYYAMVDLKGFIDAIDVVGGIDVYLETDISGLYPNDRNVYARVSFTRGWNHFDGKTALQYSRIRKNVIPVSAGSDFGRAKRQQQVIQAVLDKVAKSETLLDAKKVMELAGVASKNLKMSKVSLEDMQAGVAILKDKGKPTSYSYVLDLYAGGTLRKLIYEIDWNPYLLGPKAGANNWGDIRKFVALYTLEPQLATMTKKVVIYTDSLPENASKASAFAKKFYFAPIAVTGKNHPGETVKGKVYAIGGKTYEEVSKYIASKLGLQYSAEVPEILAGMDTKEYAVVAVY